MLTMSSDDDEEFWANEDFIATIENVVKKAEQASAARHGTQATATSSMPSQFVINSEAANVSALASTVAIYAAETSAFGVSNGPGDGFPCNAGHQPNMVEPIGSQGVFRAPPPSYQLRGQLPLLSTNQFQKPLLAEELKDVQSLPPSSKGVNPNFLWRLQPPQSPPGEVRLEVDERYRELFAEKDGAISVLRSRVKQAEQQLDELRKRALPQSASHPSLHQQQRELERLSSQLMFKDHEISEAQRANAEKEERLKDVLAETAALKEELEQLKRFRPCVRQTCIEFKRPQDEVEKDVVEENGGSIAITPALGHASARSLTGSTKQRHDPWSTPWTANGNLAGVHGKTSAGWHGKISKAAVEPGGGIRLQDESPIIQTLKVRTTGNGCVNSDEKGSLKSDQVHASEIHERDALEASPSSFRVGGHAAGSGAIQDVTSCSRLSEMYYSLQQLWGFRGVKNSSMAFLSKVYASCREDLYILLSSGESGGPVKLKRPGKRNEERAGSGTISEKLHSALAKVTSGLVQPEIIIAALLEFCKLDNVTIVGSALRVLRCILQHDGSCRQNILLRGRGKGADHQAVSLTFAGSGSRICEGKGWYMKSASVVGGTPQMQQVPMFSSPRILSHPPVGIVSASHSSGRQDSIVAGAQEGACKVSVPCDQLQSPPLPQKELIHAGVVKAQVPVAECNLVLKWMLHLALTSSSAIVKFEALAIIGVLVVNSEPLVERAMFEPLLERGGFELLLKGSAGPEIQHQAIRILHLLLHCPKIFHRLCVATQGDERAFKSDILNDKDMGNGLHPPKKQGGKRAVSYVGQNDVVSVSQRWITAEIMHIPGPEKLSHSMCSRVKLLEGMAECLKYIGSGLQGHTLHRSVIRLLAFIATWDSGAAFLIQSGTSQENPESGPILSKDDLKMEGVVGGESASGQQIIGDGSGSTRRLGDRGPVGLSLVNESVDDLEKLRNIPQCLVSLIDTELDNDERNGRVDPSLAEERDCLIHEALTLLSQLSSHLVQSEAVLGYLISNKDMARLTLSVTNRLIRRKSRSQLSQLGQNLPTPRDSDTAELARVLRRRVLRIMVEAQES